MSLHVKLAVLGAGNLGSALIEGVLGAELIARTAIRATVASQAHADELRERFGIAVTAGGNAQAAEAADVVVLAVKPNKVSTVMTEIGAALQARQVLVSFAAAVSLARLESFVHEPVPVFRAMPNLAMRVGQSATAVCSNARASDEQTQMVESILETVGRVVTVREEMMHAVTALCGSGPAFVALMVESLAAGAVRLGLPTDMATQLAEQTFFGSAKLLLETNLHPAQLREQVTTPRGTTRAGLDELERRGVEAALLSAVEAAGRRSEEIQVALEGNGGGSA